MLVWNYKSRKKWIFIEPKTEAAGEKEAVEAPKAESEEKPADAPKAETNDEKKNDQK